MRPWTSPSRSSNTSRLNSISYRTLTTHIPRERAQRNQGNRASLNPAREPVRGAFALSTRGCAVTGGHARRGIISRVVCPPRGRGTGTTRISAARRGGSPAPDTTFRDPSQGRCRWHVRRPQHEQHEGGGERRACDRLDEGREEAMRLRRHAAKSRRGVVGPTKKVLELASPSSVGVVFARLAQNATEARAAGIAATTAVSN